MAKQGNKGGSGPTANDQRSNVLNPNSAAYKAAQDNRANQKNPSHPSHPAHTSSHTGQPIPAEAPRNPNDERAVALNPNNPAYKAAQDNRSNQLNPSHSAYASSRGEGDEGEE